MTPPSPAARIARTPSRDSRNSARRLTSRKPSSAASSVRCAARESPIPALLTRIRGVPNRSAHVATICAGESFAVTSASSAAISPGPAPRRAVSPAPLPSRSTASVSAPSRASASAVSLPMPDPAPVTMAGHPSKRPDTPLPPRSAANLRPGEGHGSNGRGQARRRESRAGPGACQTSVGGAAKRLDAPFPAAHPATHMR